MSRKTLKIFLKQSNNLYMLSEIAYSSDGSAILSFPSIPRSKGIAQKLQLSRKKSQSNELKPLALNDSQLGESHHGKFRISYHTTGQVNYHGSSFSSEFFEPLSNITKQNLFLLMSFQQLSRFQAINSLKNERNPFSVIDITELFGTRIDISFSIVPASFTIGPEHCTSVLVAHAHVYQILIELFNDKSTLNLSEIYSPADCVKIKPNSENSRSILSKSDAFLHYKHILYQTNELIILPPNSEGKVEVIFSTVMRIPPWIRIEFLSPEYEIKFVEREDYRLFFKVYDRAHSRFVKDAQEIRIIGLSLDAEIYDDNEAPPLGYI